MTRRSREPAKPDPTLEVFAVVAAFWLAVRRMTRRGEGSAPGLLDLPPDDDDPDDAEDGGSAGSGVPRRPAPTSGSASAAAVAEVQDEGPR